jgi:hypothetical protein
VDSDEGPPVLKEVLESCRDQDPKKRPTAEIRVKFEEVGW